ncbi:MAG: hypothetical protein PHO07_08890 [Pirellulales bacterium]|jgi:hypothetical protein|nr:hypothetical protein [Pirellulales bacterium]MDI9446346.1 hypothetical protein [Planctomycetota bacterium]
MYGLLNIEHLPQQPGRKTHDGRLHCPKRVLPSATRDGMRTTRVIAILLDGRRREKREERQGSGTGGNAASRASAGRMLSRLWQRPAGTTANELPGTFDKLWARPHEARGGGSGRQPAAAAASPDRP